MLLHGTTLAVLFLALIQVALCAEDYYKILEVDKKATDRQLKSAYRLLSKKFHPDKNPGDNTAHDKFVEVSEAYEVLSDKEMREIYDRYGHDGVQSHRKGGGGHHDPFDLFSRFFGGGGRGSREPHGPNQEFRVEISLRDFYNGANTHFEWNKQHICEKCDGSGSADGVVETCNTCGGRGVRIIKQQLAPGMFQQMQRHCDACGGAVARRSSTGAPTARASRKPTTVDLKVERGAKNGARVVYENEADESPDYITGDLIVHLSEKDPANDENPERVDGVFFRRKGDHLFWTEVLSLREAWMGDWTRNLTHLDNHVVRLSRKPGEGMPIWHEDGDSVYHKHDFGNLYVTYEVVLPDQLDKGIESEFWDTWEKWRAKSAVNLHADSGRPDKEPPVRDEL
uniref:J domain-containing protein n=1 Tax=Bionectria ochroleuca TaxID=29856 RepID=A0A0B7K8R9_BIOOC